MFPYRVPITNHKTHNTMEKYRVTIFRKEYYRGDFIVEADSEENAKSIAENAWFEDDSVYEKVTQNIWDAETQYDADKATSEDIRNFRQINHNTK